MNRVPDPLDADERALADALARDALPGPSPQLDARILAAARAATAAPPSRRPRPRWIAGISIAATLVLAVGVAWRLRPLPPRAPVASEAPQADMVRVVEPVPRIASPQPSAAADVVYRQEQAQPVHEAPKLVPAERERESVPDGARKPAPPEPPVVFDAPSPMDTQAPPPAPPPPAAIAAPAPVASGAGKPAASTMQAAKTQPPAAAAPVDAFGPARSKEDARTLDRIEATGSRIPGSIPQSRDRDASGLDAAAAADAAAADGVSRAVLDEQPPATADSPRVQEAWLRRIRELLSAGDIEAARNSLAEFRRRYPKYALPEDLRSLAAP